MTNFLTQPNGQNVIVAYMCSNYNQEDSLIINKRSIDNGLFTVTKIKILKYIIDSKSKLKQTSPNSRLDNWGLIQVGSIVKTGDILFTNENTTEDGKTIESSTRYEDNVQAKVIDV